MRPPLRECRRDLRVRSAGELRWRLEQLALAKRATVAEIEEAMHACRIELSRRPAHCQDAPGDAAFGHAYNFKLEGLPCEVLLLVAMEFDEDQAPRLLLSPTRTMATTRAQTRTLAPTLRWARAPALVPTRPPARPHVRTPATHPHTHTHTLTLTRQTHTHTHTLDRPGPPSPSQTRLRPPHTHPDPHQELTLLLGYRHLSKAFLAATTVALGTLTVACMKRIARVAVRVADAAVAAVAAACSKLAWLDLSGATITDQSMHTIANRWPKLGRLELRGVRGVTATALSGLATHLPHMHTLFLWGCSGLNDASVQSIATHCTQLHTLCIGGRAPRHSGTGAGAPTHPGTRAASTHAPPLPPPRRPGHPHPHPGHNPNQARAPSPTAPSSPSRGASARGSRSSAWASASGLRTPPWRRSPSQNVGCR